MSVIKSPFKFLDPYTLQDRDFFFGREEEINRLYEMVFSTNLLLVYGPSGAGKTSLLQCGLASRFQDTDWFDIHVRWRGNINSSMQQELHKHAISPLSSEMSVGECVQSIYLDRFKPIFLIFDQFEELYILGNQEERNIFIDSIAELLQLKIPFKIIFSMREEYIARLFDFEQKVPHLFENRLRIEPMSKSKVGRVIKSMAERFNIQLEEPQKTIQQIIENIGTNTGIQLSYLQVYLDYLYREYHDFSKNQPLND